MNTELFSDKTMMCDENDIHIFCSIREVVTPPLNSSMTVQELPQVHCAYAARNRRLTFFLGKFCDWLAFSHFGEKECRGHYLTTATHSQWSLRVYLYATLHHMSGYKIFFPQKNPLFPSIKK